ncbi:zeaxanthin epoxidase, chloroplastic isoform X3 [Amborella trichopoda]|uniref:zeaxanthin epoxidase, chloroplastic isoform X3 n=1 Tax=Amborella trichopoda TaxID=13333 RepID=UPI0009BEE1A3|nr:zeaxanthin epoxidase, chloroplastic isoform X3 [Amborella trichopoda]|eukprot:XP_020522025.1 zeaxanthin epoxidase, chloroplastic isoform X3 [Amborella trichopoda]
MTQASMISPLHPTNFLGHGAFHRGFCCLSKNKHSGDYSSMHGGFERRQFEPSLAIADQRRKTGTFAQVLAAPKEKEVAQSSGSSKLAKKLRILIAGGGIGGLVLALAARRKGFDVVVFERDVSAIRGEGQYRGPIQIQSNALAALEAIDMEVAEDIMDVGCITGDRINGLVDGISGAWYRVFLGHKQYFVSSDVGAGKMQWYAFYKEPPGGVDAPNGKKKRLLGIFGNWCDKVVDLILATDEEMILRRDIYDRLPIFTWGKGRVTLLGDSVHAMQPNLGQGGCMAIEDGYQLALELERAWKESADSGKPIDITSSIKRYEKERRVRVAVIYGLARMAAIMASTYKPYLGVGLGPLSFLTKFRIPHPGRVGGRFVFKLVMPLMLNWVLGGNSSKLEGRSLSCRISDKASDELKRWFQDDDALERALSGEYDVFLWFLLPANNEGKDVMEPIHLSKDEHKPCIIGNNSHASSHNISVSISLPQVSKVHAHITCKDSAFFLTDLHSQYGTWITDIEEKRYRVPPNLPIRIRPCDRVEFGSDKKAVFQVKVKTFQLETTSTYGEQVLNPV